MPQVFEQSLFLFPGMFVRQTQIDVVADGEDSRPASRASSTSSISAAKDTSPRGAGAAVTPTKARTSAIPKPGGGAPSASSRLPLLGKGPTGARSPSFTNLKAQKAPKDGSATPGAAGQAGVKKERSFVEKDFRQTVAAPSPSMQVAPATAPATPAATKSAVPVPKATPSAAASFSPAAPSPAAGSGSPAMSERLEEKIAAAQAQQELMQAKDSIRDLEEKLETLKIKRAKDQEKLKEFEKVRIQHEQLTEFKSRIMESQAALQKELQKAKHEAREAIEAKERHAEEMSELSETVEMATLDKEMAEEKAETLQIELDHAKEKVEELTLDLDIIKAEMGDEGGGGGGEGASADKGVTNFEMKQQIAQNEKLRETLVRMRDLLAHEKNENMKMVKELEEKVKAASEASASHDKLTERNAELETMVADLQEQVDAALGAEEMVENLTAKCLDMEDRYAAILEEKEDLEKLHELEEELQENARDVEQQLQEDLDLAQARIREAVRARDAAYEIVTDHEGTIRNFREHVRKVQEQNADLRVALEKAQGESSGAVGEDGAPDMPPQAEMLNFKAVFEETRAHSRAVEMELRLCEEKQARRHVSYLSSYMSESFTRRGGDHEAVLLLLLVPRMLWKADILASQVECCVARGIKERMPSVVTVFNSPILLLLQVKETLAAPLDGPIDGASLLKGHEVDKHAYGLCFLHHLSALCTQLGRFQAALDTCSPETFLRMGACYPEMSIHERSVDFYIELLKKSQLDENVPLDNLEKGLHYFQKIYGMYLDGEKADCPSFLRNHVKEFFSAAEAFSPEIAIGKLLLGDSGQDSEVGTLLKNLEGETADLKSNSRTMRRRLPADSGMEALVTFPSSVAAKMAEATSLLTPAVKAMHLFGRAAAQHAGLQGEAALPAAKLSELLHQAVDRAYLDVVGGADGGLETLRSNVEKAAKAVSELSRAYQDGEWDVESLPARPPAPVVLRAEAYKAEVREAEGLKHKLEKKDSDMKELRLALRAKGEELSEMQVRRDKAEKRLVDASRDADLVREKMQRKVDDLQVHTFPRFSFLFRVNFKPFFILNNISHYKLCFLSQVLLKKKEKDFEVTMEHLQADIDQLEGEKGELKEKIKDFTKQTLFKQINEKMAAGAGAGTSSSGASSIGGGPTSLGPSISMPSRESPRLQQQLRTMQSALMAMQEGAYAREYDDMRRRLAKMKPIDLPKSKCSALDSQGEEEEDEGREKSDKPKEEELPELLSLMRRARSLRGEVNAELVGPKVVRLEEKRTTAKEATVAELVGRRARREGLERRAEELEADVARLKASRRAGGRVEADMASFPSAQFARAEREAAEGRATLVGRLRLPAAAAAAGAAGAEQGLKTVPLIVGPAELQKIHAKVMTG